MKEMFCLTCFFDNFGYRLQTLQCRDRRLKNVISKFDMYFLLIYVNILIYTYRYMLYKI